MATDLGAWKDKIDLARPSLKDPAIVKLTSAIDPPLGARIGLLRTAFDAKPPAAPDSSLNMLQQNLRKAAEQTGMAPGMYDALTKNSDDISDPEIKLLDSCGGVYDHGTTPPSTTTSDAATSAITSVPAPSESAASGRATPDTQLPSSACEVVLTGKKRPNAQKEPGLEFAIKNVGSRPIIGCVLVVYAYDASAKQLGHVTLGDGFSPIDPGAEETSVFGVSVKTDLVPARSLVDTPGVKFEAVVNQVTFSDHTESKDLAATPFYRPMGGRE